MKKEIRHMSLLVRDALFKAADFLTDQSGAHAGEVVRKGVGFGDLDADTEIRADLQLGDILVKQLADAKVKTIMVEGREQVEVSPDGRFSVFIDPLDGSLCYRNRRGAAGLPHSGVVTILEEADEPCFKHVLIGAVLDYRNRDYWSASRQDDGGYQTSLNGRPCRTLEDEELDIGRQIVMCDMYYPANRELALHMFAGEKGWITNPKSAGVEMALVSNGTAVAYACASQKHHELGAGYALVMGAGGVVMNFSGVLYEEVPFRFNSGSPVILAANAPIAEQLIERLHH